MSSLNVALNNAISGLKLNQNALSVLSNNLANVNTEGYSRKIVSQSAMYIAGEGAGVRIDDVVRKVDGYILSATQSQNSATQRLSTIDTYYDRAQVLLGEPGATNSMDEYMSSFFNTLSQMGEEPERTSYRSNVVNAGVALAQNISSTAQGIQDLRYDADKEIQNSLTEVNSVLDQLYTLNITIARAAGTGQSVAGLLDQRDIALKTLSGDLNVDIYYNDMGQVTVTTGNGVPLVDGSRHQLQYTGVSSPGALAAGQPLSPLQVVNYSPDGTTPNSKPSVLLAGGPSGSAMSTLSGGKIQGLIELRDGLLPDMLDQLDMMASRLRDSMNDINNSGSGYPPASTLTGTRSQSVNQQYDWTGSVRIAVLKADGSPVSSPYASEAYTGLRPLTIDLSALQSGGVPGRFDMTAVINEINAEFGPPQTKTSIGGINDIQLVSDTKMIPQGGSTQLTFDLNLDNISADRADVYVRGMTVVDSTGTNITNVTQGPPTLSVNSVNTYTTYINEDKVDVRLMDTSGLKAGDTIYLGAPATDPVNGISAASLTGYFVIESVNGDTVTIRTNNGSQATSAGPVSDSATTAMAAYSAVEPGSQQRTYGNGALQVDLSSNITADYYDITLAVDVVAEDGTVTTSNVTYRVNNNQVGMNNRHFASTAATGPAVRETPTTTQGVMQAILVDANGKEIPMVNGEYPPGAEGYLKLITADGYGVAIDQMDSRQLGDQQTNKPASDLGFSSYFGLNNFFASNKLIEGGDTVKNSALNLKVEQRIINNPNLISSGKLEISSQPANGKPQYTYVRQSGDNSVVQAMAALSSGVVDFDPAGGMPSSQLSLQSYVSEMLGYMSSLAAGASDQADNAQTLLDGFESRLQAVSGVNLDEELANTVIFQNAYSATARVVTVVNDMFKTLLDVA